MLFFRSRFVSRRIRRVVGAPSCVPFAPERMADAAGAAPLKTCRWCGIDESWGVHFIVRSAACRDCKLLWDQLYRSMQGKYTKEAYGWVRSSSLEVHIFDDFRNWTRRKAYGTVGNHKAMALANSTMSEWGVSPVATAEGEEEDQKATEMSCADIAFQEAKKAISVIAACSVVYEPGSSSRQAEAATLIAVDRPEIVKPLWDELVQISKGKPALKSVEDTK